MWRVTRLRYFLISKSWGCKDCVLFSWFIFISWTKSISKDKTSQPNPQGQDSQVYKSTGQKVKFASGTRATWLDYSMEIQHLLQMPLTARCGSNFQVTMIKAQRNRAPKGKSIPGFAS